MFNAKGSTESVPDFSRSALNDSFTWPSLPVPIPELFLQPNKEDPDTYFVTQTVTIYQMQDYMKTLEQGHGLVKVLDAEIERRRQGMSNLAIQCLVDAGLPTTITSSDIFKLSDFLIFLFSEFAFGAHAAANLIVTNLPQLLTQTTNGNTLATLCNIIHTARPNLSQSEIKLKVLHFIKESMPSVLTPHTLRIPEVETYITPHYEIDLNTLPYPFLDTDSDKRELFEIFIRQPLAEQRSQASIDIKKASELPEADRQRYGELRARYFNGRKGWIVPGDLDIDRHDYRAETTHIELTLGPDDLPGYCRRMRIAPTRRLILDQDNKASVNEVAEVLRSMDVMPFPQPEYYELDSDVRELAKRIPKIESMIRSSEIDISYAEDVYYPSTTEQVAQTIHNYLDNPAPIGDPIMERFVNLLIGEEQGKLNIIERLIPPFLKINMPSAIKPMMGTAALVAIMAVAAAEAFKRDETLWLFQTDAEFKQHLEKMFGHSALREIAHICQVKRDTKNNETEKYVADDCYTLLLDIKHALHTLLSNDNSPQGFAEFTLSLIAETDPALADSLRDEWVISQQPILAGNLAMLKQTPYHMLES